MRQLQPVIWSKGTFLSPQHLQAQERFVEESVRFYLESLASNAWGFLTLQIDAKAMAEGALRNSRAQVSVSITGVAGPAGGSEAKPVGTVCFAWSNRLHTAFETQHFKGDREQVRTQAAAHALRKLLEFLEQRER